MGKGDRRTKRGKIWRGTHGKRRPKRGRVVEIVLPAKPAEKTRKEKKMRP